jgi:hypothetical protein
VNTVRVVIGQMNRNDQILGKCPICGKDKYALQFMCYACFGAYEQLAHDLKSTYGHRLDIDDYVETRMYISGKEEKAEDMN